MASLSLRSLSKSFGAVPVVHDVSIDIQSGEFFSILGPSGCGKTTLLRMIAGLEQPTSGRVVIGDSDCTDDAPQQRHIGMVFQNYALFPHLTVRENVAFGLLARHVPETEIGSRVEKTLASVGLSGRRDSPVTALSGGEQQRVAVARALAVEPQVLLFDEPLSNLDAALRVRTREEIRALQSATGITTVYVTHDQTEAMSLSDRLAVMRGGVIEQVGSPAEVYERPHSPFVAEFIGGANLLPGVLHREARLLVCENLRIPVPAFVRLPDEEQILLAAKPEAIALDASSDLEALVNVLGREYLGFTTSFLVSAGTLTFRVVMLSGTRSDSILPGTTIRCRFDWTRCSIFPRTRS